MKLRTLRILVTVAGILCGTGLVLAMQADEGPAQDQFTGQLPEETGSRDVDSQGLDVSDSTDVRNGHGPSADCVQCHENRPEQTSSDAVELVAPVPRLCSTCHEEYASLDGWVHGPVVTGDCLFCHDPHGSANGSLLTKPVPELCYQCHMAEMLGLVKSHSDDSHQRCNDCHESHAGSNRKRLTQRFLSTDAGAGYIDREVYRRPYYILVDRRNSLSGLRGVRVIPAIDRQDVLSRYGLTPDLVKAEVERCLRQRGVRILSNEGQASAQPGLHVSLQLVELRPPGYPNEVRVLSGSLGISLQQTVELLSRPSDAERRLCTATTWDTSAVVVWGIPQIQEGLKDAIDVLVDKFCSDYLLANPRGTR